MSALKITDGSSILLEVCVPDTNNTVFVGFDTRLGLDAMIKDPVTAEVVVPLLPEIVPMSANVSPTL